MVSIKLLNKALGKALCDWFCRLPTHFIPPLILLTLTSTTPFAISQKNEVFIDPRHLSLSWLEYSHRHSSRGRSMSLSLTFQIARSSGLQQGLTVTGCKHTPHGILSDIGLALSLSTAFLKAC